MTVSTTSRVAFGLGNSSATAFTFSFAVTASTTLAVYYVDSAGAITDVTSSATITLNAVAAGALWPVGGTVTYTISGSPIATGTYICIVRTEPETQSTTFANQDSVYNLVTEEEFDKVVMMVQDLAEQIARCVQIPVVDRAGTTVTLPENILRQSMNLVTDSTGNVTTGQPVSGTVTISAAMIPVVTAATTALARTALGTVTDPTTTTGDMIYRNALGALARLAIGAANNFIVSNGTIPASATLTSVLDSLYGTTAGTLIVRGASTWDALAPGALGTYLQGQGNSVPSWNVLNTVQPSGRLTLVSGTAVMTTSQSAKTNVYYTPYKGIYVPIWNGSSFPNAALSELTLALDSNAGHTGYQQSGKMFDLFVFLNSGTITLGSGPAWSTTTNRGSGAGTTELVVHQGLYVNANSIALKIDATNTQVTVSALQATYVGTILASADGQTQFIYGALGANGTAAAFNVWNAYNREPVETFVQDTTNTWNYSTATWRSANGSTTMRASFICGLQEDSFAARYISYSSNTTNNATVARSVGIGYDATNALASGCSPGLATTATILAGDGLAQVAPIIEMVADFNKVNDLGSHFVQAIEISAATGTTTWYGDNGTATTVQNGLFFRTRY